MRRQIILLIIIPILILNLLPTLKSQTGLEITVQTNKTIYHQRDSLQINGNVTYDGSLVNEGQVTVEVRDPLKIILIRTLTFNITGTDFHINIEKLYPCDDAAKPITAVKVKTISYINVYMEVKNNGLFDREVYLTVSILDHDGIPLETTWSKVTVKAGMTVAWMPRLNIPNWAALGTATMYGNVFSALPEESGYPLCQEKTATVEIVESMINSPTQSGNPLQFSSAQNGTYNLELTLSPECVPGTYTIYASALYKGQHINTSTEFEVQVIPLPPWARFGIDPPIAAPNYTITFDASLSSPEGYNDSLTSYYWNFGDGGTASGRTVTHSYTSVGNYTVTLNVTDSEGFWNVTSRIIQITIIHDVAIVDIEALKDTYADWLSPITITIKNKSTVDETVLLEVFCQNETFEEKVATEEVTISCFETLSLKTNWNTSSLNVLNNYTLRINLNVPQDLNLSDNLKTIGPITVWLAGDQDHNRVIDICDVAFIGGTYGAKEGDANWKVTADIVRDGKINILDMSKLCGMYNLKY